MGIFISTFTTGFGSVVRRQLESDLPGAKVLDLYDGFVKYCFDGNYRAIDKLIYLNNSFYVLAEYKGKKPSFPEMVNQISRKKCRFLIPQGSCRVRFSRENQFQKVENGTTRLAEKHIRQNSRLRIDRVNPTTEIWYIIRSEGVGFCGQLLSKRSATEKTLHKGELRPEFAFLMCSLARPARRSTVCDPFCGYGSIPKQLLTHFPVQKVIAADIDRDKVRQLKREAWAKQSNLDLIVADATALTALADNSVDAVITDPPWGFYENIENIQGFYVEILRELSRITKKNGTITVLSARKEEFESACLHCSLKIKCKINTLVNGKKAAVFVLRPIG